MQTETFLYLLEIIEQDLDLNNPEEGGINFYEEIAKFIGEPEDTGESEFAFWERVEKWYDENIYELDEDGNEHWDVDLINKILDHFTNLAHPF